MFLNIKKMANSVVITKLSDGSFSFVVNGDILGQIINLRNDMTSVGNEIHIKTSEGANLIKLQQILYHEVTIVDGATLPVASSPLDLRIKLISVGFWDWMNPAGGGGSNRFDLLLDTFPYFGNNGKIPMVDESQLKLIPFSLPDFSYLNLFPTPLVADKGLKVNSLATAYELYDIINVVTQFIRLGYTDTVPSEDIVYKALELKANISDIPVPPDDYVNIVYVNNIDPNLATIFDLNNPPTVNDDLLKADVDNLYIGNDSSTWVYNSTSLTYVTKVINSEFSNFYLAGTTSDAGGTKTASIERSGTVGGAPATAPNHFVTKAQLDSIVVSDATTTTKGIVKLAGDLGGTADLPTVPGLSGKQNTLVSGTNIKTIEGQSLLGSGNIDLTKSDVGLSNVDNTSDLSKPISTSTQNALNLKQDLLVSGSNIKTVNSFSLLGSGDLKTFNRGFAISDDNFEDGVNSDLTLSAGWTVGSDGIAISSSGGWGNSALYNKYTALDRISTRSLVQVITTTSIFGLMRKPVSINDMGTVAQVDLTAMLLKFYGPWDGSTTAPAVVKSIAIPFSIVANRKYFVELTKNENLTVFTFTDETNVNNTVSLTYDMDTETLAGIGKHWGMPGVMFNSGSIKLKRFTYATLSPYSAKVLITGHSFVEGYALMALGNAGASYSNLLYDALIGNVAVAGRGGETVANLNTREDINFFAPTYHLVDIGANDTVYATWLSGIQTYITKIINIGAIPVLATIAPRPDRQTFINQANDWIRLSGYNYVDFAKAVSLNNDGVTQDPALFYVDGIHPNIAGHAQMFKQLKTDCPFMWDGAKGGALNLDIVEVVKTASFSVALADSGKTYVINSASAVVVTYPTGLPAGKWWEFLSIGSGAVSFVAGASATLISPDNRLKLRTQYSTARIIARASNQGSLGGDIVL